MKMYINPERRQWDELCKRPSLQLEFLEGTTRNILNRVHAGGDAALKELSLQYDKVQIRELAATEAEVAEGASLIDDELRQAITIASRNIQEFHQAQIQNPIAVETMPGVRCWRKATPIERVGIYIPGGTAPLFSTLLMLGIPAKLAGCKEIILCTPPDREGKIHPAILYCAKQIGITKLFKVGGAQAIAAMAYGTDSIPAVYKIFGPGNQYVTKAKQLVNGDGIAIDMPAGPSEVLVIADHSANPGFVAADLLSQAEHGTDSQVVLVTSSSQLMNAVSEELTRQLEQLPRKMIAESALQHSMCIVLEKENDIIDFVDAYAPEHLIINTLNCDSLAEKIANAGSVFIGQYTPESVGDYASGTNHTLPTNGFAKAFGGVSLSSFQKFITFQQLTAKGLQNIGPAVETMAEAEQLKGHQFAVKIRLNSL